MTAEAQAWEAAREQVRGQEVQDNLAQRLLRKASERTLDVEVLGERITCKWPNAMEFTRVQREFAAMAKATDDEDEATVDAIVGRLCEVAADLVLDESVTKEALMASDWGVEVAMTVCQAAAQASQEAKQAVSSFRGQSPRS